MHPLAWVCFALALITAWQTLRLENEKTAHAETREQYQAIVSEAERSTRQAIERVRLKEQRRYNELQGIANETQSELVRLRADADDADASRNRLQQRIATVTAVASQCARNSLPSTAGTPADPAFGVLAELQRRTDEAAGRIARFADAAHASGKSCERSYDALKTE